MLFVPFHSTGINTKKNDSSAAMLLISISHFKIQLFVVPRTPEIPPSNERKWFSLRKKCIVMKI
jgi:hypothetical protein